MENSQSPRERVAHCILPAQWNSANVSSRENSASAVGAACKGIDNSYQQMLKMAEQGTMDFNSSFNVLSKHRVIDLKNH